MHAEVYAKRAADARDRRDAALRRLAKHFNVTQSSLVVPPDVPDGKTRQLLHDEHMVALLEAIVVASGAGATTLDGDDMAEEKRHPMDVTEETVGTVPNEDGTTQPVESEETKAAKAAAAKEAKEAAKAEEKAAESAKPQTPPNAGEKEASKPKPPGA